MQNEKTVAIVLNAPHIGVDVTEQNIIAADGGLRHIPGKTPIAVIGDFDSLGYIPDMPLTEVIEHPVEKNATDGELAVDYACKKGFTDVVIYGVTGGRIDQVLGNINLLAYCATRGINAVARGNGEDIYYCDSDLTIGTNVGDTISVLPYGGDATVTANGVYYPLASLRIPLCSSRGISNKAVSDSVVLHVEEGKIIVVRSYSPSV